MSEQVQGVAEVLKEVSVKSAGSEAEAAEKAVSDPKIDRTPSAKSARSGQEEDKGAAASGDSHQGKENDSRDSVEVVADSAAEVKAGERDDKEEVGKDESEQEAEEKVEKTEGEEQKEKEQANVHKRKSAEMSTAVEDSSEKPKAKKQKMQDENGEDVKENEQNASDPA